MVAWVRRIARIEDDEFVLVRSLFLLHFFIICSFTLARAARDGLYLGELPARSLPYVYLGLAVWTWCAVAGFGRMTARSSSHRVLVATLVWMAAVLLCFFAWFRVGGKTPAVLFYLWTGVWGLMIVSQFWIQVNELVNVRQARRLIGFIGAGGILGGMAGGGLASFLGTVARPEWLLVVAAALHVGIAPFWLREGQRIAGGSGVTPGDRTGGRTGDRAGGRTGDRAGDQTDEPARDRVGTRRLLRRPYIRLIAGVFLLAGMTTGVIDYAFKVAVQQRLTGSEEITAFLGHFYGTQGLVALVLQIFVTRTLLSRLGARTSSMLLPFGLFLGAAATLGGLAFVPLIVTRLYDATLRISIARSAWEFLYFPLPDAVRRQAKRVMEMTVARGAEAGAGLLVLALNALTTGSLAQLAVMIVVLSIGWLALELMLNRAYVRELSQSLRRMVPRGGNARVTSREAGLSSEILPLLSSPFESKVIYALNLLDRLDPDELARRMPGLLHHPSPQVRARIIALAAELPGAVDVEDVRRLLTDPDDEVRMHAAYIYCELGPGDPIETMGGLLRADQPLVRSGALQCVASHAKADADAQLESIIQEFLERGSVADRKAVAAAVGRRSAPTSVHEYLVTLMQDADPEVRTAAIKSTGATRRRDFVPLLIARLADRSERDAAREALAAYGRRVVGTLGDYLSDPTVSVAVRRELPRVLEQIGTQDSASALLSGLTNPDLTISYRALKGLNHLRDDQRAITLPESPVRDAVRSEAERHLRFLLHGKTIRAALDGKPRELMLRVTTERSDQSLERLFRGLALIYPARETLLAYRGLVGVERRLRAQSIEFLETILSAEHRQFVLPLIDHPERPSSGGWTRTVSYSRLRRASLVLGVRVMTFSETVDDLLAREDPWLQSCTLYAIGASGLAEFAEKAAAARGATNAAVREMGDWACAQLAGGNGPRRAP